MPQDIEVVAIIEGIALSHAPPIFVAALTANISVLLSQVAVERHSARTPRGAGGMLPNPRAMGGETLRAR